MLAGRRALITGASSGIGRATAELFVREGAIVTISGRNKEALASLKAQLDASEGAADRTGAVVAPADLTEAGACEALVKTAVDGMGGGMDILVNCAGVLKGGATQDTTLESWNFNMHANSTAPFEMLQHSIPHLKAAKNGAVLNVSSVTGLQSFGGCMAYCASKAALDMMTRCAAVDLAEFGIRVNAVNPGVIKTNLQKTGGLSDEVYANFLERSKITHPLGRVGEPEECAELIAFLCSSKSGFITGETIAIDGGRQCLGAR